MKYCPECGSQLPNETIKFCPECGFKLSSQTKSDYNIVCPDCKTKIKDENSDCPNCGCPSSLFKEVQISQKHTSELEQTNDQDVICPDCGLVMEKPIPAECPSCGCPSNRFKLHTDDREVGNEPAEMPQNKSIIKSFLIIFLLIIGVGLFIYNANEKRENEAEKARQEQYEREQAEQQEREKMRKKQEEERQAEEAYNAVRIKWKDFSGTTYRASQFTSKGYQYYAFSYNNLGKGKYIIWWDYPGTNVVEEKMEFSIYKVESDANYLYLYTNELNTPVKIKIVGRSLYTSNGEERYEVW